MCKILREQEGKCIAGCDQLEAKVIEAQNQGWSMASIADIYTALQEYCPQTYAKYFAPGLPVF